MALFAISSSVQAATVREKGEIPKSEKFTKHEIKGEITVNGRTFQVIAPPTHKSVPTRAESTPVILEAPGTTQLYCKDVIGYGMGTPIQAYGVASQINWDGENAYFKDIITAAPIGSYVKASLEDGKLVLPLNQTVLEYDDEEYTMNFGLLRPVFTVDSDSDGDESVYVWFEYSDDYDSISYTIDANGSLMLENPEAKYTPEGQSPSHYNFPDYVIGYYYSDDHVWSGYCDVFQIYDEFNYAPVEFPEGLEMQNMTYINSMGMGVIVSVYEDKDALYIKGLSAYVPDAVFKADIIENGTKLSVAPNQYIGIEEDLYYVVTSTAFIDDDGLLDILYDGTPAFYNLERDPNTGKILSIKAEDSPYFLAFNDDPFYFYPLDIFNGLELTFQESFAGIPSTPYDVFYEDYSRLMGANFIFFRLSSFSYNGDIIDVNNLFYTIYINGEEVVFEEENGFNLLGEETTMYLGVKEPTTLIPYTFANSRDLYEDMGGTFIVGLYAEGIDTAGVQAVYKCDGETTYSGLVTVDVATGEETITGGTETKVETIVGTEVVDTFYYNLNGDKISNPEKGIFIKITKDSEGKMKATKICK